MLPFAPVFIGHHSVAEDTETHQLGIDTNDSIPDEQHIFANREQPIGMMRVETADRTIDGYMIDLRYARSLISRDLNFNTGVYRDEDPNDEYKTVPVLAAIFRDPESDALLLRSKHREPLKGFAVSLMQYVDTERLQRGLEVSNREDGSAKQSDQNVRFSARPQESTPDAD